MEQTSCELDAECGPSLACLQGQCRNPCEPSSCGTGAVCRVSNTLPFRTLVCECPKPLVGDASVECKPSKYYLIFQKEHCNVKIRLLPIKLRPHRLIYKLKFI